MDIIRDPGSVTYGPSAVAGVISITTHDARSLPRTQASARYLHEYGSTGGSISQGNAFANLDVLAYARRTTGYIPGILEAVLYDSTGKAFASYDPGNLALKQWRGMREKRAADPDAECARGFETSVFHNLG